MKCARCGQDVYLPHWKSNICGNCADDLRSEEDAQIAIAQAEAEDEARAKWESENNGSNPIS